MSIHIQIEKFEGPLGLLLHLIRKEEMDIFDINIYQITKQYLEYIKAMKQLDLEVAGEFIAMAATLIHIKSKMLLPQYNEDGELVENEDPRKELVSKLLEYQKFQEAAVQLYERPLVGRDVWLRGRREDVDVEDDGEVIVEEENALFALISSYRKVIKNMKKSVHKVGAELQSIAERVLEIKQALIVGVRIRFGELIQKSGSRRDQVLVTFLSLLELAKMGFVSLFQADSYSEIHIESKKEIEGHAISRVEDYDHSPNEIIFGDLSLEESESFEQENSDQLVLTSQEEVYVGAATDEEIDAELAQMGEAQEKALVEENTEIPAWARHLASDPEPEPSL
ncbi:MAG: segregation/condensation protein A [Bdellovibrionales bacterium]|nr:segregation/condensation protein A [Bdellovibrionales bacterium]